MLTRTTSRRLVTLRFDFVVVVVVYVLLFLFGSSFLPLLLPSLPLHHFFLSQRALMESDLGMTPNNNGETIRLNIPALTEERRKELTKTAKSLGEDGKTALRNVRRDAVDKVKKLAKAGDISEDQGKDGEDTVQKMTDK